MSDMTEARVREILDGLPDEWPARSNVSTVELRSLCTLALSAIASGQPVVKTLEWHPYSLKHEYGSGSWEAYGIHGTYEILDVGTDPKNGLRYYLRGIKQFDTLDEAKAAAQADYTKRILSAITKPEDSQ